jgi:hypothetical protein
MTERNTGDGFIYILMMGICGAMVIFCFFGLIMSVKQGNVTRARCNEIHGERSIRKSPSLCVLPNGRIVNVLHPDYKIVAESLKDK